MYKLYVGNFSSDSGFHIITLNNHFDIISDKSNIASNYNSYLYCDSSNLVLSTVETKGTKNNPNGKIVVFRLDNKDNPNIITSFNSFGLKPRDIDISGDLAAVTNLESNSLSLYKKYADGTLEHLNNLSTTSPAFVKIKKC